MAYSEQNDSREVLLSAYKYAVIDSNKRVMPLLVYLLL
jgi:hypothetical protein